MTKFDCYPSDIQLIKLTITYQQPVNENDTSEKAMEHIEICHIFLYSRIIELIDTLWIIMRKKNRQITFLHVFHHSFVLLMTWFYLKIAPGGSSAMFPIVNGMVHSIMYVYYILSTFESVKQYLWWKKYVTTIQLIQFIILGLHFLVAALTPGCQYPRILSVTGLAIACMFFALFITFYRETYTRSKQTSRHELEPEKLALRQKQAEQKPVEELYLRKVLGYPTKSNSTNNCMNNNNDADHPNHNVERR